MQKESICWECKHSGRKADDDYRCPWAWEGKRVYKWMKDGDGFIYRCPHFTEDDVWRPPEVFRGRWLNSPGIKFCRQAKQPNAMRTVCLEKGVMYPSANDAIRAVMVEGKCGQVKEKGFSGKRHDPNKRFLAYGYTWVLLEHDIRAGKYDKKYKLLHERNGGKEA